ncbi:MAG: RNA ligase family protein [Candidatus Promineifilaceae bacterium]
MSKNQKPLGIKNYGHIPHLPGSRMGPADHHCHEGQALIATEKARDKNDEIFVQEKLDGSNVGVARLGDTIYPLGRAGYLASTSPFEQHHHFAKWAYANADRFLAVLQDGQRLVGEWLMLAHGTRYQLPHEPFVAFDIMADAERLPYDQFIGQIAGRFVVPHLLWRGGPFSVAQALAALGAFGFHGALEAPEGAIWRVERDIATGQKGEKIRQVDFLVKYVRPDKEDGKYLPDISGQPAIWHWRPDDESAYVTSS